MKAIPGYLIKFAVAPDESAIDIHQFCADVKELEQPQQIVIRLLKFFADDSYYTYTDMTDRYEDAKKAIEMLDEKELAYLDKLLRQTKINGQRLTRDYI